MSRKKIVWIAIIGLVVLWLLGRGGTTTKMPANLQPGTGNKTGW